LHKQQQQQQQQQLHPSILPFYVSISSQTHTQAIHFFSTKQNRKEIAVSIKKAPHSKQQAHNNNNSNNNNDPPDPIYEQHTPKDILTTPYFLLQLFFDLLFERNTNTPSFSSSNIIPHNPHHQETD
jgi:quinol-cytochrome oxidoreductase complex cytochrome b subunit